MRRPLFIALACFVLTSFCAQAHSVWIEPKDGRLVIRFAEPGEKFETSPGFLDNLSAPNWFIAGSTKPVAMEASKSAEYFAMAETPSSKAVCVETTFTVRGGRKPIFYARWQPADAGAGTPSLNLDLVPTGKEGEVRLYFRGKPLADIEATLRGPDDKEQGLKADNEGYIRFTAKQSGQYLLTVAHYREPLAGFYGGAPYKETSHNAALTWVQP